MNLVALVILLIPCVAANDLTELARIRVVVEPTQREFATAEDVKLRVTIENSGENCLPVLMDPVFSPPDEGRRPFLYLTLEFVDQTGKSVPLTSKSEWDTKSLRPEELLELQCNHFYGLVLSPNRFPFEYHLSSGKYKVTARVRTNVRSYVFNVSGKLEQFQEYFKMNEKQLGVLLLEGDFSSAGSEFTVLKD